MYKQKKLGGSGDKFSELQRATKRNMRRLRIEQGIDLDGMAKAMGVKRKKYECVESLRDYGHNVSLDQVVRASRILLVDVNDLISEIEP